MKSWLGAIAICMVVSPALAENAPLLMRPHTLCSRSIRILKWRKSIRRWGASRLKSCLACKPHYRINRNVDSYSKRYTCARAMTCANKTITILHGTFIVAHEGDSHLVALEAGSFAYMPARMIDEAWTGPDGRRCTWSRLMVREISIGSRPTNRMVDRNQPLVVIT